MDILVDHGARHNIGDVAMLEADVSRLLKIHVDARVHVRGHPSLRTEIWNWRNVRRGDWKLAGPASHPSWFSSISRIPYLGGYQRSLQDRFEPYLFAALDRLINAGDIRVMSGAKTMSLSSWCQNYDGLFVAGGGNLTDTFSRQLWQRCSLIHTFAAQGKPIVLTGQQLGPFKSGYTKNALRRAIRKVSFIGIREPLGSSKICREAGLLPEQFALMGDDSFGLAAADAPRVDTLLSKYQLKRGEFIAGNIRIARYTSYDDDFVVRTSELLAALSKRFDLPIFIVPISMNKGESDIDSGHRLAKIIGANRTRVLDDLDLSPALAKGVLGQAFAAVGVSYHFCTFALTEGVPALCLHEGKYYRQKALGLSEFWGDARLALELDKGDQSSRTAQAVDLFEDDEFRRRLRNKAASAVSKWGEIFDSRMAHSFSGRRRQAGED